MPVHQLFRRACMRWTNNMCHYGGRPGIDEAQNMSCLKHTICAETMSEMVASDGYKPSAFAASTVYVLQCNCDVLGFFLNFDNIVCFPLLFFLPPVLLKLPEDHWASPLKYTSGITEVIRQCINLQNIELIVWVLLIRTRNTLERPFAQNALLPVVLWICWSSAISMGAGILFKCYDARGGFKNTDSNYASIARRPWTLSAGRRNVSFIYHDPHASPCQPLTNKMSSKRHSNVKKPNIVIIVMASEKTVK